MKKYWCIFTCNKVFLNSAIDLYRKGVAYPILFTGDDINFDEAKKVFGKSVVSKNDLVFYPEKLEKIQYSAIDHKFFISENYSRAKDRCLKMMDRLDIYGSFSRLDRDAIFNKLVLWLLNEFEGNPPDALILSENPHSHTHYLMYEICSYKNVPALKFNTWLPVPLLYSQILKTGERQIVKEKMDTNISQIMDDYITNFVEKLASQNEKGNFILPAIKIQINQNKLKTKLINFIKYGLILQIKEFWFQFRKFFGETYYPINPYKFGYFLRLRIRNTRENNLLKTFKKSYKETDLEEEFVFFALSYEPERTTNPDGNEFHDQIIALTFLRSFIPKSYKIYVKEHPTQFLNADRGSRGRSPIFYDAIQNISNLYIVNPEIETQRFIRKSKFVATISGSVGFEASTMGKKVLIFGDTWYENCPNTYKWNKNIKFHDFLNSEISSLKEIITFLIKQKNLFTIPGLQNGSAERRFKEFLDNNIDKEKFKYEELKGITHLIREFLKTC